MVALSADAYTKEGLNASAYIIDELHAHRSPALFDTLRYAGAARSQPLGIYITTAGHDRQSICYRIKGYAEKVRDGVIVDHAFFALIYGASGTDDIDAPATWRKANPSMGETIREEDFARELAAAKATTGTLNKFLRYRLNIWTESATAWIDRDAWDACGREPIDLEELEGVECHAGLDLSSTRDLTAIVPVFGDMETGLIAAPKFWLPGESAARRQEADRVPYLDWVRDGHIETCGAECIDEDQVFEAVMGFHAKHPIRRLYSDPWHAQRIARKFQDAGIDVQFMRQGPASMTAPMKELERLVMTRRIHHGGNPVLRWNADNVVVKEHDGGAITPSKSKSREKIDGITALIAAVASVMDPPTEGSGASVYATRGVVTLETPEVATHAEA
jgi:phage terminase large subunit-like protein